MSATKIGTIYKLTDADQLDLILDVDYKEDELLYRFITGKKVYNPDYTLYVDYYEKRKTDYNRIGIDNAQ